jgi:hypothetical protein
MWQFLSFPFSSKQPPPWFLRKTPPSRVKKVADKPTSKVKEVVISEFPSSKNRLGFSKKLPAGEFLSFLPFGR